MAALPHDYHAGVKSLILTLVLLKCSCGQEIMKFPQDTVGVLNSTVSFQCETSGADFTTWKVNGIGVGQFIPDGVVFDQDGVGGNGLSTLSITARAVYNGTTIQCVTGKFGGVPVESEIVTLTIQGLLSSVVNLETASSTSSITVSWSAPFSLDVTGVDSDIWYSVLIYNVTDEENPTAVPCTDCHNLTQTHYIFSPDYPSPCYKYTFTVIPYNGAGQGENVTKQTHELDIEHTIQIVKDNYEITVHFKGLVGSDDTYSSTLYIVGQDRHFNSDMGSQNKFQLHEELVCENQKYEAYIQLTCGSVDVKTSLFDFKTFDVQNVTVDSVPEGILVAVKYINGSSAVGSFIVVKSGNNRPDHYRPLYRNRESDVISLPPDDTGYTVLVYDLEEDGLPSTMPAVEVYEKLFVMQSPTDYSSPTSTSLKRAKLSISGSEVTIRCKFTDDYPEASCVLIYREYNDPYLTVEEYDRSTEFPVTISVDNTERYTFALFGKNGIDGIDSEPVIIKLKNESAESPPKRTGGLAAVIIVVVIVIIIVVTAAGVLFWKSIKKRKHGKMKTQYRPVSHGADNTGSYGGTEVRAEQHNRKDCDMKRGINEPMMSDEAPNNVPQPTTVLQEESPVEPTDGNSNVDNEPDTDDEKPEENQVVLQHEMKMSQEDEKSEDEEAAPSQLTVEDLMAKPMMEVSKNGDGGPSELVAGQQVKMPCDVSNFSEERGTKVHIMMFCETTPEQCVHMHQPIVALQEHPIDDGLTSFSNEANGSESPFDVECSLANDTGICMPNVMYQVLLNQYVFTIHLFEYPECNEKHCANPWRKC